MTNPGTRLDTALVWFRRDLRATDNAALHHALKAARRVWCVFVLDREILDPLPRADRRVEFIVNSLHDLNGQLAALAQQHGKQHDTAGAGLIVRHGFARDEIVALAGRLKVQAVFANHDDEPAALARDAAVRDALAALSIAWHSHKDHVVFERAEVLTGAGKPYSVFTPYKNAWLKKLDTFYAKAYPIAPYAGHLAPLPADEPAGPPTLADIGFETTNLASMPLPAGSSGAAQLLADFLQRIHAYEEARNFPAIKGPSYLSVHLRFGTVSVRELVREAWQRMQTGSRGAEVWLSELIWRDFYHQVLHHHPRVVNHSFKPEYDSIVWESGATAEAQFQAWCDGRTGYPLVDAAMAQINQTGYMHNRLRMVVASFLVKDLGIDWRWGERYFAEKLIDFDLAANNGGWQWAASTGCDAQPYFRIFNPVSQSEKFDPSGKFIRRYVPALDVLPDAAVHAPWGAKPVDLLASGWVPGRDYPKPIVQHDEARQKTLQRYAVVRTAR